MSSLEVQENDKTDTLCPVCEESIHGELPVGVTTGCGHCWHQQCYRKWQKKETLLLGGDEEHESASCSSSLNCLICQQPTRSFVDLFIRLPNACSIGHRKDLVTQLEHEFHTVSRRTQLSLERELARREFEQTWLQEERQLSLAARQRVEERHAKVISKLEENLKELQVNFERKRKSMESRRKQQRRRSSESSTQSLSEFISNLHHHDIDNSLVLGRSIASLPVEGFLERSMNSFTGITVQEEDSATDANENVPSLPETASASIFLPAPVVIESEPDETNIGQQHDAMLTIASATIPSNDTDTTTTPWLPPSQDNGTSQVAQADAGSELENSFSLENLVPAMLPRTRRAGRAVQKDTIFYPNEEQQQQLATKPPASQTRSRRSVLRDEIFAPTVAVQAPTAAAPTTTTPSPPAAEDDRKLPAMDAELVAASSSSKANDVNNDAKKSAVSRKRKGSLQSTGGAKDNERTIQEEYRKKNTLLEEDDFDDEASAVRSVAEYERQRLQAESAYYQHQAELVEWERHQAEIELEQDELALQQREQRIRMERSRLEESFSSIQRRVRETKHEARDRQKIIAMEEKFVKYKAARSKEEKRFQNELEHLKQDDVQILERENCEKKRQEMEKVRLKKELNQLVKVMNELERCKEMVKLAEEQSSSSQSHETCVVCFEPLVNEESELGVAVPCGHTFHSSCFSGWEKSKRRRGAPVPCPLCNVGTNLCVTIRMNRPASSLDFSSGSSSSSSLARHFQKEEGRWQRRRLTGTELVGEEDLS